MIFRFLRASIYLKYRRFVSQYFLRFFFANSGRKCLIEPPLFIEYERIEVGENFRLWPNARIEALDSYRGLKLDGRIIIGNNVSFQQDVHVVAASLMKIGNDVTFGPRVTILDNAHTYCDSNILNGQLIIDPVEIGDSSFLGAGAVVLPGTKIGKGCIVGANSVVKGSFAANSVIVGSPAKVVKKNEY